jgi:NADH-quinone oxidoreductase subunit N
MDQSQQTLAFTQSLIESLLAIRPELLLAAFAMLAALIGAIWRDKADGAVNHLGVATLLGAGVLAILDQPGGALAVMNGSLVIDPYASVAKAIIAFSAAATLAMGSDFFSRTRENKFEFPILTCLATLGMFIMVSANDLIALYVGVELQSLSAYVLAAWRRDDARSSEAGLKYFVLGALASGLLLYGASLIYGFTGSVSFPKIAAAAQADNVGLIFGMVFLLCGLAFKLSAAPFHMWTPDVYEGAPTPVTAFFAAAPKLAMIALLARVLLVPFEDLADQWRQVIVALAGITLVVGAVIALAQTNLKRLMAYSSIHNVGFALMALAAGGQAGASAALMFMAIYLPTTIGIFAVILATKRDGKELTTIEDLNGLAQSRVWMAGVLTMLLFSVFGIPPLAGCFGKVVTIQAALGAGLWPLAVVAVLATVISAAYYLRLIAAMWIQPAALVYQPTSATIGLTVFSSALLSFPLLTIGFGWLSQLADAAARASFS